MKKLISALFCLIFISACGYSEPPYSNVVHSFMETIKEGDTGKAFEIVFPVANMNGYNAGGIKLENLNSIILRTNEHLKLAGKAFNYVKTEDIKITPHLTKIVYIAHHQKTPIQWTFYFMKSESGDWHPLNINFNDKVETF